MMPVSQRNRRRYRGKQILAEEPFGTPIELFEPYQRGDEPR